MPEVEDRKPKPEQQMPEAYCPTVAFGGYILEVAEQVQVVRLRVVGYTRTEVTGMVQG